MMLVSRITRLFVTFFLFASPLAAHADVSSLVWGGALGGPEQVTMADGGTYAVPLNTSAPAFVTGPLIGPDGEFVSELFGNLYKITDSGTREYIETLYPHNEFDDPDDPDDGDVTLAWPSTGSYELDILSLPPAVVSFEDRLRHWMAQMLFAGIAHAQFGEPIFHETIRFTIEEAGSCASDCFSNVLFLPGLEASRLYDTDGDRLWEPPFFGLDHEKLLLDQNGTPVHSGIYTEDVIDEAFTANIYKSFIRRMDGLVADGTINEWNDFPYDWRFDVYDTVNNPTTLATTTVSLIAEVERLAASSKSGKVTIISHSNGGLVGKALISELDNQGKSNLVDKFVMVAVPQLGTPKTIATLLHGEAMPSEWFPFVAQAREIREIGENMPSGYTLLPSLEYLARVLDPVIEFDTGSALTQPFVARYGLAITNIDELKDFLLGAEGRLKPAAGDVLNPNILNTSLLAQGEANHAALDNWQAPAGIEVIQIVGWGVPTIRGIEYVERTRSGAACAISDCRFLDHTPQITIDGDKTVVVPSANSSDNTATYYLNIREFNDSTSGAVKHSDILETPQLLSFISELIRNNVSDQEFISSSKPLPSDSSRSIRLKIHSPVSVDIYDNFGHHTGIATTTFLGMPRIEEQIPNSYYFEMGEGKYAGADVLGTTTLQLSGLALGTFTLDIEQTIGDTITASTTFTGIPVTASTTATLGITNSTTLASSTLSVDVDGDGKTDAKISSGEGLTVPELLGLLRGLVQSLDLPAKREKKLLKAIDKLEKHILKDQKGKKFQKHEIRDALGEIKGKIKSYEKKKLLTKDEVKELLDILGKIENLVIK